jgi:tetratricopeptide (TPR) repeat protein
MSHHQKVCVMKITSVLLTAILLLSACGEKQETDETVDKGYQSEMAEAPERDISNEALLEIDGNIQPYIDAVEASYTAHQENPGDATRQALVDAYVDFGDYMQYDTDVTPRQGRYHRALIEYRHALELDPDNQKVIDEIAQIEEIYESMGRPIPAS